MSDKLLEICAVKREYVADCRARQPNWKPWRTTSALTC